MKNTVFARITALTLMLAVFPILASANLEEGTAAYYAKDYSKARQELLPIAQQGVAQAQRLLGNMHLNGWGVVRDDVAAAKWIQQSAEHGDVAAMRIMASLLVQGRGVEQDFREARKWFRRADAVSTHSTARDGPSDVETLSVTPAPQIFGKCGRPQPSMPRLAVQNNIVGTVRAALLLDEGVAKDVIIYSGPRVFHDVVRQAMLQYDCLPDTLSTLAVQEFVFVVDNGADTKPIYTITQREPVFASEPPSFNSDWYGLSKEQKLVVKGLYVNLTEDDEPPYPTEGMGDLVENIRLIASQLGSVGLLRIEAKIGANGKVETVNVLEAPDAELGKRAAGVVFRARYKAALCAKQACAMVLPVDVVIARTMPAFR